jgi:hypothetical protein
MRAWRKVIQRLNVLDPFSLISRLFWDAHAEQQIFAVSGQAFIGGSITANFPNVYLPVIINFWFAAA